MAVRGFVPASDVTAARDLRRPAGSADAAWLRAALAEDGTPCTTTHTIAPPFHSLCGFIEEAPASRGSARERRKRAWLDPLDLTCLRLCMRCGQHLPALAKNRATLRSL